MHGLLLVIADRCQGVKWRGDTQFVSSCPNYSAHKHGDKKRSFSATMTHDRVLLKCHGGCTIEDICRALEMEQSELFLPKATNGEDHKLRMIRPIEPRIVATYDYTDETGKLLFQSVRYEPKDFRQRRPDGNGGWVWDLKGVRPVLYHLPEVVDPDNKTILICEGEKDCETAHRITSLPATTNPMGAGKWRPEFNEYFRDKQVIIFPDADAPGIQHAEAIAKALYGIARQVKLCRIPAPAKDFSDWQADPAEMAVYLHTKSEEWSPANAMVEVYETPEEFRAEKPISFAIEGFLQNDAPTAIAGLAGHGKTLVMMSMVKALLTGKSLWGLFHVPKPADRVIYLIPESTRAPFKHRLELFRLLDYIDNRRLLVRTLSKGPVIPLSDPRILESAKGAHVFLDTAIRFAVAGTDENSASDNQALATDIFNLLSAGALAVVIAQHATKAFRQSDEMFLENVMRGTGDMGAMVATAWGLKQIDLAQNILHVENVKPRDFQPKGPFQLQGRPSIDETGDFTVFKAPGDCGTLAEEAPNKTNEDRASTTEHHLALVKRLFEKDPNMSAQEMVTEFKTLGIPVGLSTMQRYRAKARKK